ncbi:alcohol dehydrogenase catalytic domain-containing protein [Jiangella alkaliphila]|uniref:D-arabinose 1-dehydrogenase, Zn-dependent alcohol dehydrogenase family n=1 Tax=Jiangella alkaliphila TaxID=419479 RepID=A0A1H2G5E7_9ACTN|nr:alcohol dehydrogenase catalytic domain-containing protein [Jiangella alkaliphila]SDU14538.1 D-arabinose 1-dehydrogenase, Zn-dependent alcohol dehydrogenase family [Jiangella alkaliphila]
MSAAALVAPGDAGGVVVGPLPVPRPSAGEVLIAVRTVGANHLDLHVMHGRGPGATARLPLVPGIDPAGEIVDQGPDVPGDRRGERVVVKPNIACGVCVYCLAGEEADCTDQRVVGGHRDGGAAEFVAVPSRNAIPIGGLDFATATAAVHSVPVALHAIEAAGGIEAGATVLVTGATGAVGAAAVQLARHAGARVLAASTSADVSTAGAEPLRYTDPDDLPALVAARAPDGAGLVVDGTGRGDVLTAAARCLAWRGRLVLCAAASAGDLRLDPRTFYQRRHTVVGAASASYADVARALELVAAGVVVPEIAAEFPLAQIHAAWAALGDRGRRGKVVIRVR